MTLGDVADRILTTEHNTVFVCLESTRTTNVLWFQSNFRECLEQRRATIESINTRAAVLIINRPTSRITVRLTCQDEMIKRPFILAGYIHSTPMFTAYGGGWAESTIR